MLSWRPDADGCIYCHWLLGDVICVCRSGWGQLPQAGPALVSGTCRDAAFAPLFRDYVTYNISPPPIPFPTSLWLSACRREVTRPLKFRAPLLELLRQSRKIVAWEAGGAFPSIICGFVVVRSRAAPVPLPQLSVLPTRPPGAPGRRGAPLRRLQRQVGETESRGKWFHHFLLICVVYRVTYIKEEKAALMSELQFNLSRKKHFHFRPQIHENALKRVASPIVAEPQYGSSFVTRFFERKKKYILLINA